MSVVVAVVRSSGGSVLDEGELRLRWWCDAGGGSVDGRCCEVVGAVGSCPCSGAVWCEGEDPVAFVDEVVIVAAEWRQVGEIGAATDLPGDDVVDFAVFERHCAGGADAAAMHCS